VSVRLKENQSIMKSFSQKIVLPGIGVQQHWMPWQCNSGLKEQFKMASE